mmetsp:Transcript_28157/g.47616  ORF Transcript_28157/g.47616 Transcript_28157/m.47616 type:complete len:496 (+) Transcript_28157:1249-2736(+)
MASWKMMRRTDPIKEFLLEPLHAPHTKDLSSNTILVAAPNGYLKDNPDERTSGFTSTLALFRRLIPTTLTSNTNGTSSPTSTDLNTDSSAPPDVVYLLVPGHFSGSADLKQLWGGDMDVELDDDDRQGAGAGDSIRFTCRSVKASSEEEKIDVPSTSATVTEPPAPTQSGTTGTSDGSNARRGWWRELASGNGAQTGSVLASGTGGEPYVVRWDTIELSRLYKAQQTFLLEKSVTVAVEEVLKFASPIIGAAALPLTVLERAAELDCPWLVVMDRAEQAGRLMAALLLENAAPPRLSSDAEHQQYRQRSVSLVGYGFGARVIVHCLMLLAAAPNSTGLGIVQDVVLIGAPVSSGSSDWLQIRKVVSGRLVNCYKTDDWMLGLMYRSKAWEVGVAGLGPVDLEENLVSTSDLDSEAVVGREMTNDEKRSVSDNYPGADGRLGKEEDTGLIKLLQHDPAWRTEVENVDVSDLVPSHLMYAESLRAILHRVGIPTPGE